MVSFGGDEGTYTGAEGEELLLRGESDGAEQGDDETTQGGEDTTGGITIVMGGLLGAVAGSMRWGIIEFMVGTELMYGWKFCCWGSLSISAILDDMKRMVLDMFIITARALARSCS